MIPHKAPDAHMFTQSEAQHAANAMIYPVPASHISFEKLWPFMFVNVFFLNRKQGFGPKTLKPVCNRTLLCNRLICYG